MKLCLTASLTALLCMGPGFAQNPAAPPNAPSGTLPNATPKAPEEPATKGTEISGCLTKTGDKYSLSSTSGSKMDLNGPAGQLDQHANHEVKVTGELSRQGQPSFSVSKVEMISSSCITKS